MPNGDPRIWIFYAEEDFGVMETEKSSVCPRWTVIAMLAQQSAEKYLKALLVSQKKPVQRTHNLNTLVLDLLSAFPDLSSLNDDCRLLTRGYLPSRYPLTGQPLAPEEARKMSEAAERIRAAVMPLLSNL
jgi:HEPN domain-containing protein